MIGDVALPLLENLAEEGVVAGFLGSDAPLDAEESDLGEEAMDFLGSGKSAGGFGELGDEEILGLGLVGEAELGTGAADGLGALASCARAVLTTREGEIGLQLGFRFEKDFTKVHWFAPWIFALESRLGVPLGFA